MAEVRPTRIAEIDYHGYPVKLLSTDMALFGKHSTVNMLEGGSEGEVLGKLRTQGAVYISENMSHRFDLHAGDRIALGTRSGTKTYAIVGVAVDYTSDLGTVMMDRKTYLEGWADDRVDTFELHLAKGASIEGVRGTINERYGEQRALFVLTNREFRGEFEKAVNQIFQTLRVLQLVTLIVAALSIVNAVLANVLDRVREIGVLRAIGMLRSRLRRLIVLEATMVGAIGTVAGGLIRDVRRLRAARARDVGADRLAPAVPCPVPGARGAGADHVAGVGARRAVPGQGGFGVGGERCARIRVRSGR